MQNIFHSRSFEPKSASDPDFQPESVLALLHMTKEEWAEKDRLDRIAHDNFFFQKGRIQGRIIAKVLQKFEGEVDEDTEKRIIASVIKMTDDPTNAILTILNRSCSEEFITNYINTSAEKIFELEMRSNV